MTTIPDTSARQLPSAIAPIDADRAAEVEHYADLVEQLFIEYEDVLSLTGIVGLVRQCRHDLAGSPIGAMPELLERLARCRLSTLAEQHSTHREPAKPSS
jgi:hypothetical protein